MHGLIAHPNTGIANIKQNWVRSDLWNALGLIAVRRCLCLAASKHATQPSSQASCSAAGLLQQREHRVEGCAAIWLGLGAVNQKLAQLQPEGGILAARRNDVRKHLHAHFHD